MTELTQEVTQEEATEPKTVEITVANPSDEAMAEIIAATEAEFSTPVSVKPFEFKFKKSVDKDTGVETVRHPVVLAVPYPTVDGILAIVESGGKGLELLLDSMSTVVNSAARDVLYTDTTLTAETFPVEKVSWDFIANLPKPVRNGGGIAKEVWEAFGKDYVTVMPEATGKTEAACVNASKLLVGKMTACRTNKKVVALLVEMLTIYSEATDRIEDYAPCIEFLLEKAEGLLNVTDEELLSAL